MNRVILIGLDGFRPEMMSEALTPNLMALAQEGVRCTHHRSVFPSETYVNVASILTGVSPGAHGIVANKFFDPKIGRREPWAGSRVAMIEAGVVAYHGGLITAPTLGDRLTRTGKRLWVFSGNSPGSARLKHPRVADCPGHLVIVGQCIDASRPKQRVAELVARLGRPPRPAVQGETFGVQRYLTDAFLSLASREGLPEAVVLWYGEPDHSYHSFGLGAEPTRAALRAVDGELGRVIDWWRGHPEQDRIQLIVTSDHGHITQTQSVDTAGILIRAGFRVGKYLDDDAELALVPGYAGNIRLRQDDPGLRRAAVDALMSHPDTGLVFTSGGDGVEGAVPGTFDRRLVLLDHARSPDIFFTLRADDAEDRYGFTGTCRYDNGLPAGVGYHGGLHPAEMAPLLVMAGSAFAGGRMMEAPSSVMDVLPTMLSLLGEQQDGLEGRVLADALAASVSDEKGSNDADTDDERVPETLTVGRAGYSQALQFSHWWGRRILDHGRRLT